MNDNKNILAIRIKKMRTDLNLTQEELAIKLGLKGKSSIANYESGNITPSDDIKLKMCEIFDCSMDYLLGKTEFKTREDELSAFLENQYYVTAVDTILKNFEEDVIKCGFKTDKEIEELVNLIVCKGMRTNAKEHITLIKDYLNSKPSNKRELIKKLIVDIMKNLDYQERSFHQYHCLTSVIENEQSNVFPTPSNKLCMCPVYGHIAAGVPNWADQCMEGTLPLDPDMMHISNPEECFFLRVSGESMNKVVKNGGYALIRKQEEVENGEIAVVLVNGYDATLKKFTKKDNMVILEPMSDDPTFQIQLYGPDTPIQILGKYIGKFEMN